MSKTSHKGLLGRPSRSSMPRAAAGDGCARQPRSRSCREKSTSPTLVWIDDYEPGLALYKKVYEALGYRIHTASRGRAGLALLASRAADVVVVDYEMPDMNGGEVAATIKRQWPSLPVVLFSGSTFIPDRVKKLVDALCDKASPREHLHSTIQHVLSKKEQTQSAISFMTARRGRLAVA